MAQPGYKEKLRNHSATSPDGTLPTGSSENLKEVEEIVPESVCEKETQTVADEIPVIAMEDFKIVDANDKLNLLMAAINKVNTNFHLQLETIQKQMTEDKEELHSKLKKIDSVQKEVTEMSARLDDLERDRPSYTDLLTRMQTLETQSIRVADDVEILKGYIQTQEKQIDQNKKKIVNLTARSMANNITISGILGDSGKESDCKEKVINFMSKKMLLNVNEADIEVAHRLGKRHEKMATPRLMVVRCSTDLRSKVFDFTKNLKDAKNEDGDSFYLKPQLPEPLYTEKKEREDKLREIRKTNAGIAEEQKHKRTPAHIMNKVLFVNNKAQRQYVFPPTAQEVFNTDAETKEKMEKIKLFHSTTLIEKQSKFTGFAVHVKNVGEVKLVYRKLKVLYPECDHIMMAYSVKSHTGHHDNGEYGALIKLLNGITQRNLNGVALFVTREYGGIQLGQRRFLFIEKVAKEALNYLNV